MNYSYWFAGALSRSTASLIQTVFQTNLYCVPFPSLLRVTTWLSNLTVLKTLRYILYFLFSLMLFKYVSFMSNFVYC